MILQKGGVNMKVTTLAVIVGVFVASLGLIGLVNGEGRFGDAMNINLLLDIARITLGSLLILGGLRSPESARNAFAVFAVAYLGVFLLGIISPTLFGALPAGLGWLDQTLHLGGGLAGLFFKNYGTHRGGRLAY
jgi:hypothetical protein